MTQSTQLIQTVLKCNNTILYTNTVAAIKDFVASKEINYVCIALIQNRFVLPDLPIAVNLSKYKKALCFLYKNKKAPYNSFYEDKWFLNSGTSTYFISFESDFVDITLDNYSWVEPANSKAPLFIVAFGTILIEHEIFDPTKETTKVAISKI